MVLVDAQMNYGISSAHVQWFSCRIRREQMIVMSLSDITVITHAIGEGSI